MNLKEEFSKQLIPEERQKTAVSLKELRHKLRNDWLLWDEKDIKEIDNSKLVEMHEQLKNEFSNQLSETEEYLNLKLLFKKNISKQKQEEQTKIQQEFDIKLANVLEKSSLSLEDQEKYLSEEFLIKLDLDDYLILMKRLSGLYASHVTRYGVREQILRDQHTIGEGEFMDSFTGILKDHRLHSLFSNIIKESDYAKKTITEMICDVKKEIQKPKKQDVIKFIMDEFVKEQEDSFFHPADLSSVHMGVNDTLDRYYGSEVNYGIYFYFPAEVIAKNYHHQDGAGIKLEKSLNDFCNDLGVWNKGKGIPIDAGIVCIPKNIFVDKETGSQYLLDNKNKPTIIPEAAKHVEFYHGNEKKFEDVLLKLKKEEKSFSGEKKQFYESDNFNQAVAKLKFNNNEIFRKYYEFGAQDKDAYYNRDFPPDLRRFYQHGLNMYYERAPKERLVSSEAFWGNYFSTNPEQKPSKIFYYSKKFKNRKKQTKVKDYEKLFSKKRFLSTECLPDYNDYANDTYKKVEQIIGKIYDEISNE